MTRERLPDTRNSITHKAVINCGEGGKAKRVKFFVTVGLYPDGRPGELFLHMDEAGSTLDGTMDSIGILLSFSLQFGVPLEKLVKKLSWQEFEPRGFTNNPDIPVAKSVVDYVLRWMEKRFLKQTG
ncbi:MAG: hypothetical protein WC530_09425 [Candidatus Omnitrophota bacterium]|jgi:ribonucleoside-diphosphate reductase alpha chain